ncbi:MAG: sulfur carrier protein ThiS [Mariprofundales bacterium]|nr:sulfur carrier protein ThiS [Mariprofundales bacterium]
MQIQLNGESREIEAPTLALLVAELGLETRTIAIEYNLEVAPKSGWGQCQIHTGDRIEVVQMIGGG